MYNQKKIEESGAEDYRQGRAQSDNPYDAFAYPEEHGAWLHGFRMEKQYWDKAGQKT